MLRLVAALALMVAVTAQVPPSPCPHTPANYCTCGAGDHGYRYLCRANNGHTWETNDEAPIDPCPCKYPTCTLPPKQVEPMTEHAMPSCGIKEGDSIVFADMHDGDQKKVSLSNGVITIVPHANNQTWTTSADFSPVHCTASIDFNVPDKPSPPPINLTATFSMLTAARSAKAAVVFNDKTGKLAPASTPLNAWIQLG
eukprot:TRINITY_DN14674_c0_g1_i1.p1 TRINITY_DN14674_c0_g1~~TRINITY_DN14674_c0_g1_i1.p1  ORF type:complete len:198 (+),score=35.37 TRINITY_DN14674_c0_g1_i1:173-766(+)